MLAASARLAALTLLLSACSSSDGGDANPPRLYIALLGSEVGATLQLVPVEPNPF